MKAKSLLLGLLPLLMGCTAHFTTPDGDSQYESFAPDGIPFTIADSLWKADGQGNHRAVVKVSQSCNAVLAELPWRRADIEPEKRLVKVVSTQTGKTVDNVLLRSFSAEKGEIVFEPTDGEGLYYIYYLPYKYRDEHGGARYKRPWNLYFPAEYHPQDEWKATVEGAELPQAEVLRFESRSRFDFLTCMGVIATKAETDSLLSLHPENPVVFCEDRAYPIRLKKQLPVRWVREKMTPEFKGTALRGEYYVWQLGLWAAHGEVNNVRLAFSDLKNGRHLIPSKELTCFNQEGINWDGKPISFNVNVPEGEIQALWCGVQIPQDAATGVYKATVTLSADGIVPVEIPVSLGIDRNLIEDSGDGDLWRHSRLRWLNSRIGIDSLPVAPYERMQAEGKVIKATGKTLTLADNGLPAEIQTNGLRVLSRPMDFVVETDRRAIRFTAQDLDIHQDADGLVSWQASSLQDGIRFSCRAHMEYDGYIRYNVSLSSEQPLAVKDIRMEAAYTPEASEYFMGIGFKGGSRPSKYDWDWKGPWDSFWMGGAKAGLHIEYRGGNYNGPLMTEYLTEAPRTWSNDGKGTIRLRDSSGGGATVTASTGADSLSVNVKDFEFALLITPLKEVDPAKHFSERYSHGSNRGADDAARAGANILNLHHNGELNPVINYPFIVRDSLIAFVNHEHKEGLKVKLYYTLRELSNYATEIYALRSLGHEIYCEGPGRGSPWHHEHLLEDYHAAWYAPLPDEMADAALKVNGFSRWVNYYLEGLRWMFENYEIDGIYMDDVAFDRNVMKRIRKIMAKYRPEALIDLHSNERFSAGPANQYTDFFPYIDRIWFGEEFKYDEMTPDEWFVTFSGIPFGQMSEMLQDGGNRFLGMVYGTTARYAWSQFNPAPVWALWKSFGIEEARMLGYWDNDCPIHTDHPLVKATAYVKNDKVLISIGNFDNADRSVKLTFDWASLGMNPESASLEAPEVENFQKATSFKIGEPIPVKAKEGWLLILSGK